MRCPDRTSHQILLVRALVIVMVLALIATPTGLVSGVMGLSVFIRPEGVMMRLLPVAAAVFRALIHTLFVIGIIRIVVILTGLVISIPMVILVLRSCYYRNHSYSRRAHRECRHERELSQITTHNSSPILWIVSSEMPSTLGRLLYPAFKIATVH
jgi:multisubunit Na+/H+ antiporter MnhC subunit